MGEMALIPGEAPLADCRARTPGKHWAADTCAHLQLVHERRTQSDCSLRARRWGSRGDAP